jgi:release factor glutamine methyltransferase
MVFSASRLRIRSHPEVYEPAEDSVLLANSLDIGAGERVLEIGVGSGYVSLVASERAASIVGIDINPHAARLAKANARLNGVANVEFIAGDLFSPIRVRFNLILVNPPYLPVKGGAERDPIELAWDGGEDGMRLTERFINEVQDYLEPNGRVLMIQSSLSGYEETVRSLSGRGFQVKTLAEQKLFFETIYLIEARRL